MIELAFAAFAVTILGIALILSGKAILENSREPGKRYFGFNCEACRGKYRNDGTIYYRCIIKKPIVTYLLKKGLITTLKKKG